MASATIDSAAAATDPPLQVDSLPTVDLRLLSQSELYSLSLCSPSTFDPLRCDDVVIPKIDRSVFNESAGSRKQTYSRLRLAPASAAAASPSSLRRRTPHLRHSSNLHYRYLDTDPENAENQQILGLLKQLFGLDSSSCVSDGRNEELVHIRVDYSHSLPQFVPQVTNDSHLVPQSANVGVAGTKRKRGRPRKNENALALVENKVEIQCINDNLVSSVNNAIVMYQNENVEDRDKEILNKDGVEVDLVALGAMEDPYGLELRRRTEGMGTEEALLEFLRGLDGQWGSRRKKRRIVDASEFGNALPRGWALLLSVKKKDGSVWLFCRRYISPNGRQFVSCKEISSYLLSLLGIQSQNQLTSNQSNPDSQTANSMYFVSTVGVPIVDEKIEVNPVSQTSPSVASTYGNFEIEVALKTGDVSAVQVGEILHCDKCEMTFIAQDDLLQHQLSHRRRRSRNGESVTDGVIIKDGKFECQICHKTFLERHRYNGHMGAHVRNQVKCPDQNQSSNVKDCLGTGSFDLIPPGSMAKSSLVSESNSISDIPSAISGHVLNIYSPHSNDKQNGDFKEPNDKLGKLDEAMDGDILKPNLCSNSKAVLHNNGKTNSYGTFGGSHGIDIGIESGIKKSASVSCSPVILDQKPGTVEKTITGLSVNIEEPQGKADAGSVLLGSNENAVLCDTDMDDGHLSRKVTGLGLEADKYVADESTISDKKHDGQDVTCGVVHQQHSNSKDHSCRNVDNVDGKLICTVSGSKQDIGSTSSMLAPSVDKENCYGNVLNYIMPTTSSMVDGHEHRKIYAFVGKESGSTAELNKDSAASLQGEYNEVSTCFIEGHEQPKNSGNSFPSLSPFEVNSGVQPYANGASARQMVERQVHDVQNVRNNEFFPFSSNSNPMNLDSLTGNKHERILEFRSFFPSEDARDDTDNVHSNLSEESRRQPPGSILLSQSFSGEASQQDFNVNKIFAPQVDSCKLSDTGNSQMHDLCLASDSRANNKNDQLERYPVENFDVQSGIKHMFGVESNMNNAARIVQENPREVRSFGIDLHESAFIDQTCFSNSFNMIYQGKVWEGQKIDEEGNADNKFMIDFDGSNPQPVEGGMSGSIWRTAEENFFQTGLANTSTPPEQTSNSFRNFDIISHKGEEGLGVNQNYAGGTGFEGLRLGRSDPVEYSFITTQSSNSIPGEPKCFSYDVNTGQDFDSSFWLGKDTMMPNVTGQNQVPTVCVWCRNEFYQDPISSGAQTGAIGSICPACNSKISQQFNVL